jgi:hypothetical protein
MKTIVDHNREALIDPVGTRVVRTFSQHTFWACFEFASVEWLDHSTIQQL